MHSNLRQRAHLDHQIQAQFQIKPEGDSCLINEAQKLNINILIIHQAILMDSAEVRAANFAFNS